jgi:hypothetical protein
MECQRKLCPIEGHSLLRGFGRGCMKPWIPNCFSVLLIACALQYGRSWDKSLSYVEFSYNNSYQESLKMAPFEMLYGRRCRTPLFWNKMGERRVFGPDVLEEAEKQVCMVRENLRVVRSRQKSYADHRRRELSFEVGDFVYLKVSPMRGLRRFKV